MVFVVRLSDVGATLDSSAGLSLMRVVVVGRPDVGTTLDFSAF